MIESFAPMQSGVCRESSRLVIFFGFEKEKFKFSKCTKWVRRKSVVVMKLLQYGTKNGCLDIQLEIRLLWCRRFVGFLNDEAYCSIVTRNSFPINPRQIAYDPKGCGVPPTAVYPGSPSVNDWFQTLKRPSSGSQMLKSPKITPTP